MSEGHGHTRQEVFEALKSQGHEVLLGKDSGFYVRGRGFLGLAEARRITGISAPERTFRERTAYGDYATILAINGITR